jgi:hypothetical protein
VTEWKSEINENGEEVPVPLITHALKKEQISRVRLRIPVLLAGSGPADRELGCVL